MLFFFLKNDELIINLKKKGNTAFSLRVFHIQIYMYGPSVQTNHNIVAIHNCSIRLDIFSVILTLYAMFGQFV